MGKLVTYLFVIIVILLGIPNFIFCMNFVFAKSNVNGSPTQTNKIEIVDDVLGYSINYNLNEGILAIENPLEYNLFTPTFKLNNPTKDGYTFCGWTGSNGDSPQLTITICKGSCGNLEFIANYVPMLDAPVISIENTLVSWESVQNADYYEITINNDLYEISNTATDVDLGIYKTSLVNGQNVIKLRACSNGIVDNSSEYSNIVYYTAEQLTIPYISIEGTNVVWTAGTNVDYYIVKISDFDAGVISQFNTTETWFDFNDYSSLLVNDTSYLVRVVACSERTGYLNSRSASEIYIHQSTIDITNLTEISSKNKVTFIDKLENGEHIGALTLDLVDIDGNIWQFRTSGIMYDTYSECDDVFDIYKLNLETNEFEKSYTKESDRLEFFNNTRFYFGNDKYFKFINYEPSVYDNVVFCFARHFANYFVSRADERLERTMALEYVNSYECTEEYTYTDYAWEVFTLIEVYESETNDVVIIADEFKIEVTDYGVI